MEKLNEFTAEEALLDFYKSISPTHREEDEEILIRSIESGVLPHKLRYGVMKSTYRGVIENKTGDLYYFSYMHGQSLKLVKADSENKLWEANRIIKHSTLGCDLLKAKDEKEKDKHADEETTEEGEIEQKASPVMGTAMPNIPEAENVAQQDNLTTDVHPGGVGDETPDGNASKWHPEAEKSKKGGFWEVNDLLKGLSNQFKQGKPLPQRMITDREREFLMTTGKTAEEIDNGATMTPMQKVQFRLWLGKSLNKSVSSLDKWLKKK
jgi:hypothetical protein